MKDRTVASLASIERLTMDCTEEMIAPAATITSLPRWGIAAWTPLPLMEMRKQVHRGHDGTWLHREPALGKPGPVVKAEHRIDGKIAEQTLLDHLAGAAFRLLGGLENEAHPALEGA